MRDVKVMRLKRGRGVGRIKRGGVGELNGTKRGDVGEVSEAGEKRRRGK